MTPRPPLDVFQRLQPAEQDLLLEFVLVSGSLKALAKSYGVSYPTIRARLDRLIERVEALRGEGGEDLLANKLADLVETGSITPAAARELLALHRSLLEAPESAPPSSS